jgi:hypothetical protein
MLAVPVLMPLTTPVLAFTVAFAVWSDDHVPAAGELPNVTVAPTHMPVLPVMAVGNGFTSISVAVDRALGVVIQLLPCTITVTSSPSVSVVVVYVADVAPLTSVPSIFHWYNVLVPALVVLAENVTEVPAHTDVALAFIEAVVVPAVGVRGTTVAAVSPLVSDSTVPLATLTDKSPATEEAELGLICKPVIESASCRLLPVPVMLKVNVPDVRVVIVAVVATLPPAVTAIVGVTPVLNSQPAGALIVNDTENAPVLLPISPVDNSSNPKSLMVCQKGDAPLGA